MLVSQRHPSSSRVLRGLHDRERSTGPPGRIDAEQFFACEMRVGRIVTADDFPEARKPAYTVRVDFGSAGVLRTSAQITQYQQAALPGRLVVGVVNLEPKRIAGFTSQFLLLGSYDADGTVHLLSPAPDASPGDRIG